MGTATRVFVDNYEAYPGIFRVSFDSGDVRAAVVLTRPQLEQLRAGQDRKSTRLNSSHP